jgi:2-dehydro-3-deoxyphosphogluconate aldolase/(4S)-4-hydroxy-2-oxoglutarate aldolase
LAGAQFLVTPTLDRDVIETAHTYGLAVIPGVGTATEALTAMRYGADAVKLFPASQHVPRSLRDLLAALPQLSVIPTGGIGLDDVPQWLDAGAMAVGLGSELTRGQDAEIHSRLNRLLETTRGAR